MIVIETSASYAPRTDVPACPTKTKTAVMADCTRSATQGVPQRGWTRPKPSGRK